MCSLDGLSLHFCVVLELNGFGRLDTWTLILVLADFGTWSSSLDGDDSDDDDNDDADDNSGDDDDDDDDDDESRTRLLPTHALFVFAFFAKRQPCSFLDNNDEESPGLLVVRSSSFFEILVAVAILFLIAPPSIVSGTTSPCMFWATGGMVAINGWKTSSRGRLGSNESK